MNAPTVAPEIQQEAARSLLERLSEKNALVRFFRYNASAKHGVPIDPPPSYFTGRSESTSTTTTTTEQPPNNGVTVIDDTKNGQTGQTGQGTTKVDVAQTPPNISVNVAAPPAAVAPASSGNDILKGIIYTLAALAALGGAIALGYAMSGGKSSDQTKAPTTTTTTDQQQQVEKRIIQSPLQFLEDIGAHRPEIVDE